MKLVFLVLVVLFFLFLLVLWLRVPKHKTHISYHQQQLESHQWSSQVSLREADLQRCHCRPSRSFHVRWAPFRVSICESTGAPRHHSSPRNIMKQGSFSCWTTKKLYSTTKLQKRYTTNSCFFSSWQDASPVWIHIDFLWDIALPPCHVPGPPRLGNVWFRLGETGHDQHLGVWYLVDFFCLESFDCWGLHSGQTGKFETLFVLAGGQVSFSYNKCVWGFWNRFFFLGCQAKACAKELALLEVLFIPSSSPVVRWVQPWAHLNGWRC